MTRGELAEQLHYVFDIERLMTRTVYGSATPKEIYALAQTCDRLPQLRTLAESCSCPELAQLAEQIDPLADTGIRSMPPSTRRPRPPERGGRDGLRLSFRSG